MFFTKIMKNFSSLNSLTVSELIFFKLVFINRFFDFDEDTEESHNLKLLKLYLKKKKKEFCSFVRIRRNFWRALKNIYTRKKFHLGLNFFPGYTLKLALVNKSSGNKFWVKYRQFSREILGFYFLWNLNLENPEHINFASYVFRCFRNNFLRQYYSLFFYSQRPEGFLNSRLETFSLKFYGQHRNDFCFLSAAYFFKIAYSSNYFYRFCFIDRSYFAKVTTSCNLFKGLSFFFLGYSLVIARESLRITNIGKLWSILGKLALFIPSLAKTPVASPQKLKLKLMLANQAYNLYLINLSFRKNLYLRSSVWLNQLNSIVSELLQRKKYFFVLANLVPNASKNGFISKKLQTYRFSLSYLKSLSKRTSLSLFRFRKIFAKWKVNRNQFKPNFIRKARLIFKKNKKFRASLAFKEKKLVWIQKKYQENLGEKYRIFFIKKRKNRCPLCF